MEANKETPSSFFIMEEELDSAKGAFNRSNSKMEGIKCDLDLTSDLENQLLGKMIHVDYLQLELQQLEGLSGKTSEYESYFACLEAEKKRLQEELQNVKESVMEANKETPSSFFIMEEELDSAKGAFNRSNSKMEGIKCDLDLTSDLENQLLGKMIHVDYLQLELQQLEGLSGKTSEYESYFACLEAEKKRLQEELQNVKGKMNDLNLQVVSFSSTMLEMKDEISEMKEREVYFEVEIATLKADLHRSRSTIAAADARALSLESGMHLGVQQLALQAEASKIESRGQKKNVKFEAEIDGSDITNEATEVVDLSFDMTFEINKLKDELEVANSKISDLRSNLEEATIRANIAEKAKAEVEDQLKKWREEQRRKASTGARTEQFIRKDACNGKHSSCFGPPKSSNVHATAVEAGSSTGLERTPSNYTPLAKVLDMKL